VQDKYESDGMIANIGVRLERFDGGSKAIMHEDLFNMDMFTTTAGVPYYEKAAKDMFAKAGVDWEAAWGYIPEYETVLDCLGVAPGPADVAHYAPGSDAESHWRFAPRFGISHPVTETTKFFFNFGQFHSMQKASVMYGYTAYARRVGVALGRLQQLYNPSLRPAETTMYEVGVEHVLPFDVVMTVRGYAKYNVDQITSIPVRADGMESYAIYRNTDYEDIKGAEMKLSRSVGRFVNGWFTFERFNSRSGAIGLGNINSDPTKIDIRVPARRSTDPKDVIRAGIVFKTPGDWGQLKGRWGLTIVQSYRSGGDVVYNPDRFAVTELNDENFLPVTDSWYTSMKLSKRLNLPGRRTVMAYMDVSNLWNRKSLNGSALSASAQDDYKRYIFNKRNEGEDLEYGASDTFDIFTRPYRDDLGNWKPPLAPRAEWLLFPSRRVVRFGMTFSL